MRVLRLSSCDLNRLREEWTALERGVPFCTWTWLTTWWRCFGPALGGSTELFTLGVFDDLNRLVGAAPWYVEYSPVSGRILRPLGAGEAGSRHLATPCRPGHEESVLDALTDWLTTGHVSAKSTASNPPTSRDEDFDPWSPAFWSNDTADESPRRPAWDLLELTDLDCHDQVSIGLAERLRDRGAMVAQSESMHCRRIDLPPSMKDFVASLAPERGVEVKRLLSRYERSGEAELRIARTPDEVDKAYEMLDRHRNGEGRSPALAAFQRDVTRGLHGDGRLQLGRLMLRGKAIGATYAIVDGATFYASASSFAPEVHTEEIEQLSTLLSLRWAFDNGYTRVEFLDADDSVESLWNAAPCRSLELRIARAAAGHVDRPPHSHAFDRAGAGLRAPLRQR